MFLSASALEIQYDIDPRIAKFYVDREPPQDNLYWEGKLLYLRPNPGYIFLPLIADLYFRMGIQRESLLNETYVSAVEQIGHFAASEEIGMISYREAQNKAAELVKNAGGDEAFVDEINAYFNGDKNEISRRTTSFRALHRGDIFLYAVALLPAKNESRYELISTWFALITTLLMLDDAEDYELDLLRDEENAFIESGGNREGFGRLQILLEKNLKHISSISRVMSERLHQQFASVAEKPGIKYFLND